MSTVLAPATTQTTVTGLITDPGGNPATGGTVTFVLSPSSSAIAFRVAGTSIFAPRAVVCQISPTGQLLNEAGTGPCLIWGNPAILPGNTTYTLLISPTVNGSPLTTSTIYGVLIFGSTYDLSNIQFAPNVEVTPQQTVLRADPVEANLVPITGHVFNLGSQQLPYASIFADNLDLSAGSTVTTDNIQAKNIAADNITTSNLAATNIATSKISATTYVGLPPFPTPPPTVINLKVVTAPIPTGQTNVAMNWPTPFADINYSVVVSVLEGSAGNTLQVLRIVSQTPAQILVTIINNDTVTHTGTLYAHAIHF